MNITIEHPRDDQFNVALTNPGQPEPFITIKGCRIVQGQDGPFVSWPARKQDNGKWWNHVYASKPFAAAVLSAYNKSKASAPPPARRAPPAAAPAAQKPAGGFSDMDDDIPF